MTKYIKTIEEKKPDFINVAMFVMMAIALGEDYVVRVIFSRIAGMIPIVSFSAQQLMYGVFILCFFVNLVPIINSLINKRAFDVFIVLLTLIISVVVFIYSDSDYTPTKFESYYRLLLFYPAIYIVFRSVNSYDFFLKWSPIIAYVFSAFGFWVIFSAGNYTLNTTGYNMSIGYILCLSSLILFANFINAEKKNYFNIINLIFGLVTAFFSVINGSRGSLVVIFCFLGYYFFKKIRTRNLFTKIIVVIFIAIVLLLITGFGYDILSKLLDKLNMSSRTIDWLFGIESDIGSSGRNMIYESVFSAIRKNPFGNGLFADRIITNSYAHSFILEIICDYGLLFGTTFIVLLFYKAFSSFVDKKTQVIASIIVIYSIVMLMVSSSIFFNALFWCALGIMFNSSRFPTDNKIDYEGKASKYILNIRG